MVAIEQGIWSDSGHRFDVFSCFHLTFIQAICIFHRSFLFAYISAFIIAPILRISDAFYSEHLSNIDDTLWMHSTFLSSMRNHAHLHLYSV